MKDDAVSDSEIMAAARSQPDLFGVLFDRHFLPMFRYLARRAGADIAEELAADVFVVAFRRLDNYDLARDDALPWLYGIATNLLRRHRRSESRRLRAVRRFSNHSDSLLLEDRAVAEMAATDLLSRVNDVLSELPRRDRDPLLLHVWEGLSWACQVLCVRCWVHVVGSRRPGKVMANALSACFQPWVPVPSSPPLVFPMLRMAR